MKSQLKLKGKYRSLYSWYTVAFFCFALCYFGVCLATGHSLIWQHDAAQQHLQVLQDFHQNVWHWIRHPNAGLQLWSWHLGLGSDTMAVYAYYALGDVFSYLALLVPLKWVSGIFQLLIIVRLYCAGAAFIALASKTGKYYHRTLLPAAIIAGAITYIASGYTFYAAIAQPFFINPLIQLPLLLLAAEHYMATKKWAPLVVMFAWIFINSFYFAFMLGIGFGIYLIIRLAVKRTPVLAALRQIGKILWWAVVGGLIAAAVLFPTIAAMQGSSRVDERAFANGIISYNLKYYVLLPVRLISESQFSYWALMWFVAPVLVAIVFVLIRWRRYPIMASLICMTGVFLLFPQMAAMFNGFASPSNRWLFMAALVYSLAVSVTFSEFTELTSRQVRWLATIIGIYLVVLAGYSLVLYQTSSVSLIALGGTMALLGAAWWRKLPLSRAATWLAVLVVVNAGMNSLIFMVPFTGNTVKTSYAGNFMSQLLRRNTMKQNTTNLYAGLDKKINSANVNNYRANTLSQNYLIENAQPLSNALNNRMQNVSSFYSVINGNVASFSKEIGNQQYRPNVPLAQLDDRTILNNFLGVKYLFVQTENANAKRIPATYHLSAATKALTNNYVVNQQTRRYTSNASLPLLWWTNKTLTARQAQKLTLSQREYMLMRGVVTTKNAQFKQATLPQKAVTAIRYYVTTKKQRATQLRTTVKKQKRTVVKVSATKLVSNENNGGVFTLHLALGKQKLRNTELHVEVSGIKYHPATTKQLLTELKTINSQKVAGGLASAGESLFADKLAVVLAHANNYAGYQVILKDKLGQSMYLSSASSDLSEYKHDFNFILNAGYFKKKVPHKLKLKLPAEGTYTLKLKVVAVSLGKQYRRDYKQIQRNSLQSIKRTNNKITARLNKQQAGIVTSTIPYTKGWHVTVDGKPVKLLKTNYGFIGFKVAAGKHRIVMRYMTPGLQAGLIVSGVTLILVLAFGFGLWMRKRK